MANFLSRLFSNKPVNPTVSLEQAAELLKTSPEALAAFESAYHTAMLEDEGADDNFFQTNSRQASAQARDGMSDAPSEENLQAAIAVGSRIVEELVAQTRVYVFDGDLSSRTAWITSLRSRPRPLWSPTRTSTSFRNRCVRS